ncbi:MAG TPA: DUF4133 domain-containing protein [Agriterribacter sp.]|nr:DUF4133 domain-containing protein [Agriterribacter sp.]HRQ51565.1 DUF4133 domain-containing protein [Agriterribacter sp.]
MANSVYQINKGINKSIEFRGLKAQYIWYLAGGMIGLLILFAAMYFAGVNTFICLGIIVAAGTGLFIYIYGLSNKYGEYGMMKKIAKRNIPDGIKSYSREVFIGKTRNHEKKTA